MTKHFRTLLLSCAVLHCLPAAWAEQAEAVKSAEISGEDLLDDSEAVSQKLEAFIKGAVESGLLQSSDPEAIAAQEERAEMKRQCLGVEVLDFSDFSRLEAYEELIEFRNLINENRQIGREASTILLATAYLSLGLEAEATLKLQDSDSQKATILKELLALISGKPEALAARLEGAATCMPEARFWYGVAILEEDTAKGADLFNQGIVTFRTLPFQLQATVAARAVPILDRDGRKLLSQKIMASFTPEQLKASSKLQFNQALLDLSLGKPVNMRVVEGFLDRPSATDNAMRAILARDEQPHLIDTTTRVDEALRFIQRAETQRDRATRLHVVLRAYLDADRYQDIRTLSKEPLLQTQESQDAMAHVLITHVSSQLEHSSLQKRVSAVNFLVQDSGLLVADKSGRKLMQEAVGIARESGFHILAGQLLEKLDDQNEALPGQAEHAFRRKDYDKVYALAAKHPEHADVVYFAALSAVGQGADARLGSYEPVLRQSPMKMLQVIEADVLAQSWLVPEATYTALETAFAASDAFAEAQQRLARARLIRERGMAAAAPQVPDFTDVSALLASNRADLGALNKGSGS